MSSDVCTWPRSTPQREGKRGCATSRRTVVVVVSAMMVVVVVVVLLLGGLLARSLSSRLNGGCNTSPR